MCYVSIQVFKTKMPTSNFNTLNVILKFIKQWLNEVWFLAQLRFTMNSVTQGGKKEREGVGWKATLNQGHSPHSLTLVICMYVINMNE